MHDLSDVDNGFMGKYNTRTVHCFERKFYEIRKDSGDGYIAHVWKPNCGFCEL